MMATLITSGFTGRNRGWPVVCSRVRAIMPGANGRTLPFGWET